MPFLFLGRAKKEFDQLYHFCVSLFSVYLIHFFFFRILRQTPIWESFLMRILKFFFSSLGDLSSSFPFQKVRTVNRKKADLLRREKKRFLDWQMIFDSKLKKTGWIKREVFLKYVRKKQKKKYKMTRALYSFLFLLVWKQNVTSTEKC